MTEQVEKMADQPEMKSPEQLEEEARWHHFMMMSLAGLDEETFNQLKSLPAEEAKGYVDRYVTVEMFRAIAAHTHQTGLMLMPELTLENLLDEKGLNEVVVPAIAKAGIIIRESDVMGVHDNLHYETKITEKSATQLTEITVTTGAVLSHHVLKVIGLYLCRRVFDLNNYINVAVSHINGVKEFENYAALEAKLEECFGKPDEDGNELVGKDVEPPAEAAADVDASVEESAEEETSDAK